MQSGNALLRTLLDRLDGVRPIRGSSIASGARREGTTLAGDTLAGDSMAPSLIKHSAGAHPAAERYMARCPAHADRDPSLSIRLTDDGVVLVHCFAGCSPDDVLRACGLRFADLFAREMPTRERTERCRPLSTTGRLKPDTPAGARPERRGTPGFPARRGLPPKPELAEYTRWVHVATYPYTDEMGRLLFSVDRLERIAWYRLPFAGDGRSSTASGGGTATGSPAAMKSTARREKRFLQWHTNAQGDRVDSIEGCRRVLYMLPDVVSAIREGVPVVIVEGEKDADTANLYFRHEIGGYVATTNPGGAGAWRAEYNETLRGADIILCGDADPAGQQHVGRLARELTGCVRRLRTLDIAKLLGGAAPRYEDTLGGMFSDTSLRELPPESFPYHEEF